MTQGNLGEFHHSNIPGSFLVDSWDSQELVGECKELNFRVSQRAERNPKGILREET